MVQILLPFTCRLKCLFCGSQPFKECKQYGYSEVLRFIEKVYFDFLKIEKSHTAKLHELVYKSIEELRQIAIEDSIKADLIEDIDSMAKSTTLVSVMYLPYIVLSKLKLEFSKCNLSQQIIITAYVTRWVAKILVEQCLDYKTDIGYYLKLIKEAGEMGSKIISLGGFSDMFDSPDYLIPIVELVKSSGMYGVMHTSGFVFNESLMEAMIDFSWDEIEISLHTTNPGTAAILRGSADYVKQAECFMLKLNDMKRKKNRQLPHVNCVNVINKFNYKELLQLAKWVSKYEIRNLFFNPMWLYSQGGIDIKMGKDDIDEFKQIIITNEKNIDDLNVYTNAKELLELKNMHLATMYTDPPSLEAVERHIKNYTLPLESICIENATGALDRAVCPAPWFQIAIDNQGGIKLCAQHTNAPFTSNIHTHSLSEIWYGKEFNLARKNYLEGKLPIDCTRYCSRHPSFYNKKMFEEYLGMKNFLKSGQTLPESFQSIISETGH